MGCATSNPEARKLLKVPTLFGGLNINVLDCHLEASEDSKASNDIYFKIIISNQFRSTRIIEKAGFNPHFDEKFVIPLNSCYKPYGRSLEVFVLARRINSRDKLLAYALIDLDTIIKRKNETCQLKTKMSNEFTEIGFVNLVLNFE